ncbi:hypothetical protein [Bifidobacterium sp. ESL0704]|uniref:hypothetical protein n=1 Tax=Bifidobacterium sp. ESL0704 TaxID=2983219 RepID=UPI0023F6F80D|nr:hypothetical protein [Bifidobacterium sp. ESL0704]WEV52995.1 hypothetical protein OZX64_00335 [Bifidobacterium sp. ESL0704]
MDNLILNGGYGTQATSSIGKGRALDMDGSPDTGGSCARWAGPDANRVAWHRHATDRTA